MLFICIFLILFTLNLALFSNFIRTINKKLMLFKPISLFFVSVPATIIFFTCFFKLFEKKLSNNTIFFSYFLTTSFLGLLLPIFLYLKPKKKLLNIPFEKRIKHPWILYPSSSNSLENFIDQMEKTKSNHIYNVFLGLSSKKKIFLPSKLDKKTIKYFFIIFLFYLIFQTFNPDIYLNNDNDFNIGIVSLFQSSGNPHIDDIGVKNYLGHFLYTFAYFFAAHLKLFISFFSVDLLNIGGVSFHVFLSFLKAITCVFICFTSHQIFISIDRYLKLNKINIFVILNFFILMSCFFVKINDIWLLWLQVFFTLLSCNNFTVFNFFYNKKVKLFVDALPCLLGAVLFLRGIYFVSYGFCACIMMLTFCGILNLFSSHKFFLNFKNNNLIKLSANVGFIVFILNLVSVLYFEGYGFLKKNSFSEPTLYGFEYLQSLHPYDFSLIRSFYAQYFKNQYSLAAVDVADVASLKKAKDATVFKEGRVLESCSQDSRGRWVPGKTSLLLGLMSVCPWGNSLSNSPSDALFQELSAGLKRMNSERQKNKILTRTSLKSLLIKNNISYIVVGESEVAQFNILFEQLLSVGTAVSRVKSYGIVRIAHENSAEVR